VRKKNTSTLDGGQRRETVAIGGGALEVERLGRRLHLAGELLAHRVAAPGQERLGLPHQGGIVGRRDLTCAGRRAALDLVQQAGARAAVEHRVRAGADEERALERGDRTVHRLGRCKRPVIVARTIARAAVLHDLRRRMILGDEDVGERLVIPHQDVEARAQPLDQIGLEQQSLGLGRGGDEFEPGSRRDHALDAGVVASRPRIGDDALADVLRLADVEHLAGAIEHAIDAGRSRRVPGVGDDGGTAGGKPGRRRFLESGRHLVLELRQARILLVVLEAEIGLEILFQRRHDQEVMPEIA
jgi:hypothetical protein